PRETRHRAHGQTRRLRERRRRESPERRLARRRRRFCRGERSRRLDHAGARRRRADDDCHAPRKLRTRRWRFEMNPLLDFCGLPRFGELKAEHIAPAVDQLLADGRATIDRVLTAPVTWEGFVAPLEDANERIGRAWGQVAHLHAVLDSPELREAYNANLPKITQYWTELGQNQRLFEKYQQLAASSAFGSLSAARKRIVENALRDFRLGGAELPPENKARFAAIQEELA